MKRFIIPSVILVLLLSTILGSCGGGEEAAPEGQYGGTLRIITPLDPTVLGYPPQSAGRSTFFQYCVLERLAIYAPDVWQNQDYQGILATSWEYENDMKTWTFHLREGVKFHDGTDWNAEAVKWNADLWVEAKTSATFNDLASCDIIDEYTVQYNFNNPKSMFMVDVATGIYFISPTSYEANGGKDWAINHPVGTGPFKLVEAVVGSHVYYERFDDYWAGKPYLDKVQYTIVPDATTSEAMMEAGEADMYVYAELKQALDLDAMDGFYARFCKHHTPEGVWFQARDPDSVFYDKRVREAFEYAVDREAIVNALSLGCPDVEVMYQAPISTDPAYRAGWGRKYDVGKAKELMEEAGKSAGFETTIYCNAATPRWHDLALMLQSYLAELNVTLNIEIISPGQYMTYLLFGWPTSTLFVSGIPNEPIPPYVAMRDYRPSPEGVPKWNYSTATTPEMNALYAVLENATSPEAAMDAYVALSNQAMDDAIGIYMMDWPDTAVFADYVHSDWISYSTKVWNANLTWMEPH
jgi:peptide/nickel transport system substrate-binding protein